MEIKDIQNEREGDYGDAKEAHKAIADSWSVYLSRKFRMKIELEAKDVAILMVLFKSMREAYKHKYDNLLDLASYADFAKKFCEVETGDTRIFDEVTSDSTLCQHCYYHTLDGTKYPCSECDGRSEFRPNNVPNEVPYSNPPDEVADICESTVKEDNKCKPCKSSFSRGRIPIYYTLCLNCVNYSNWTPND